MTNQQKGGPAFPLVYDIHDEDGAPLGQGAYTGMSLRDYFAAHAPDVPAWFKPEVEAPLILTPKQPDVPKGMAPEDEKAIRDWVLGGFADLPEHLSWYQEQWDQYFSARDRANAARNAAEDTYRAERLFAWRWFYADKMLKARGQ